MIMKPVKYKYQSPVLLHYLPNPFTNITLIILNS